MPFPRFEYTPSQHCLIMTVFEGMLVTSIRSRSVTTRVYGRETSWRIYGPELDEGATYDVREATR
jgi:hypothetical protein